MATTPIYGKSPLKIFFRTRCSIGGVAFQVCLNDGPRLTLTYLILRSNLLPNAINGDFFFEKMIF